MIGDMYLMDINNIEKLISLKQEEATGILNENGILKTKKLIYSMISFAWLTIFLIETPILLLALMRKMIIHFPL